MEVVLAFYVRVELFCLFVFRSPVPSLATTYLPFYVVIIYISTVEIEKKKKEFL
jgi:hypothetical protein